jgi:hypothetical protein
LIRPTLIIVLNFIDVLLKIKCHGFHYEANAKIETIHVDCCKHKNLEIAKTKGCGSPNLHCPQLGVFI